MIENAKKLGNKGAVRSLERNPVYPKEEISAVIEDAANGRITDKNDLMNIFLDANFRHLRGMGKGKEPFIETSIGGNFDSKILSFYNRTLNAYNNQIPSNEAHSRNIAPLREAFKNIGTPEELETFLKTKEGEVILKMLPQKKQKPKNIKKAYKILEGLLKYDESLSPEERALHGSVYRGNNKYIPA